MDSEEVKTGQKRADLTLEINKLQKVDVKQRVAELLMEEIKLHEAELSKIPGHESRISDKFSTSITVLGAACLAVHDFVEIIGESWGRDIQKIMLETLVDVLSGKRR